MAFISMMFFCIFSIFLIEFNHEFKSIFFHNNDCLKPWVWFFGNGNLEGGFLQNLPAYPAAWPPNDDPIMWILSQDAWNEDICQLYFFRHNFCQFCQIVCTIDHSYVYFRVKFSFSSWFMIFWRKMTIRKDSGQVELHKSIPLPIINIDFKSRPVFVAQASWES